MLVAGPQRPSERGSFALCAKLTAAHTCLKHGLSWSRLHDSLSGMEPASACVRHFSSLQHSTTQLEPCMVQVWLGPRQQGDSAEASWAAITDTLRPWSKSSSGAPQMGPVQPRAAWTGTPLPHARRGWTMRDGAHRPGSYPCTVRRPLTLQGMSDEAAPSAPWLQMTCLPISTIATPRTLPAPMTGLGCRGAPECALQAHTGPAAAGLGRHAGAGGCGAGSRPVWAGLALGRGCSPGLCSPDLRPLCRLLAAGGLERSQYAPRRLATPSDVCVVRCVPGHVHNFEKG